MEIEFIPHIHTHARTLFFRPIWFGISCYACRLQFVLQLQKHRNKIYNKHKLHSCTQNATFSYASVFSISLACSPLFAFAFAFPLALVSNVFTCECVEHFCRWILMANNNNLLSFGLRCGDSVAFLFAHSVCMCVWQLRKKERKATNIHAHYSKSHLRLYKHGFQLIEET